MASLKTPLAKFKGLGSAKSGTGHWWHQRITALALFPLSIWFVVFVAALTGADYETILEKVRMPLVSVLLVLFFTITFYHFKLGVQVVVEDYIHDKRTKIAFLFVLKAFVFIVGLLTILSIFWIFWEGKLA